LKIRHGTTVENTVTNLSAKFNYDRLQNEKVLGNLKSDNNNPKNNKNNICRHWGSIPGTKAILPPVLFCLKTSLPFPILNPRQWWANPKSNPQPQILNLWTSNPKSEKANPKSQTANTQIKSNLQTLNPKSFPNLQKLTYYHRKLDRRLCS